MRRLVLVAILGAGCREPEAPPGLAWARCGAYECATVEVPTDDLDVANGVTEMRLLRSPARDVESRIGSVVVVVGGPGGSGVEEANPFVRSLDDHMPEVLDRFDVVFYERRGSGDQLECVDDAWVDAYRATAPNPSTDAEWDAIDAIWQELADGCTASGALLPTLGSETEARDIDRIREALGEDEISVYAISGGTWAGASYAAQFPDRLRALVVDSPLPPTDGFYLTTVMTELLEASLDRFLADCGADAACAFHGGEGTSAVAAAYDALSDSLATPLDVGGRPAGAYDLDFAVQTLMIVNGGDPATVDPQLASMLAAAEAGDGAELLEAADPWWYRTGATYDVGLWSVQTSIMLDDIPCPVGFDRAAAEASLADIAAIAPRMGPSSWFPAFGLGCLHWPAPRVDPIVFTTTAPALVVAATSDLNVGGIAAGDALATAFGPSATLVTRTGFGHVQYARSDCAADAEARFLIEVDAPNVACAE